MSKRERMFSALRWLSGRVFLLSMLGFGADASAKRPAPIDLESAFRVYHDAGMRTWQQRYLPEFLKVGDSDTQKVLADVSFRVVRFADFNAFADYDHKRIVIPVGLLITVDLLADAIMLSMHDTQCVPYLQKYLSVVGDAYIDAAQGRPRPLPDFPKFCGLDPRVAERTRQDPDQSALKATIIVDSVALVVGHEIGHLVKRHRPSEEISAQRSREQEYEADAFGLQLADRAGFFPQIAIGTIYPFFAYIENDAEAHGRGDHPPAACRAYRLIAPLLADGRANFSHPNKIGMTRAVFAQNVADLKAECDKAERGD